jgi:hypothetical protein
VRSCRRRRPIDDAKGRRSGDVSRTLAGRSSDRGGGRIDDGGSGRIDDGGSGRIDDDGGGRIDDRRYRPRTPSRQLFTGGPVLGIDSTFARVGGDDHHASRQHHDYRDRNDGRNFYAQDYSSYFSKLKHICATRIKIPKLA